MGPKPLASAIMPTYNRPRLVRKSIEYFLRQDYEPKEIIVVDDGAESVEHLIPAGDDRFQYVRLAAKHSIGLKRNIACERARGEIILHWDDDDWHAPHRIGLQVEHLLAQQADVNGIQQVLFYDVNTREAARYEYPPGERFWLYGNSLCYRRSFWEGNRFPDVSLGEDTRFLWTARDGRMVALPDNTHHVSIIHGTNVSARQMTGSWWKPGSVDAISEILAADWDYYAPRTALIRREPNETVFMTVARTNDLGKTEFAAFNFNQSLPWMRRWELPYALFAAQLQPCMAVLDCTINPVNLAERLAALYPNVLYRHATPLSGGVFSLPVDVPDGAFDRVFCVNTLEHLVRDQREALIAEMAHKLKPGGRLVLTCDSYFDSSWTNPVFLQAGVMRPDRRDVHNGWNKVTQSEWIAMGERGGLFPLNPAEPAAEPEENDPSLYRNLAPYPHASIGGVFVKGTEPGRTASRKLLFALLTWNTREISEDSVRAYTREAAMLERLGHQVHLCVCDNGSVDGTPAALRELLAGLGAPHTLIANPRNCGNSIARNQIIDCMLEQGADYLLFIDGDIEIVPFSSFAMMRYMEDCGRRLGCIGADSAHQTPLRDHVTPYLYSVHNCQRETVNLVAWTQYGMFRREVFECGIRFDENPPFDGAGWGFEDNDLAFQMEMKGFANRRFFGMVYLHRAARSSIRIMREQGIDPVRLYEQRKQYVIEKWAPVDRIDRGPLNDVRRVALHL